MDIVGENLLDRNQVVIVDDVDRDTYLYLRGALIAKIAEGSPDLTIHISSNGGLVSMGLGMYDLLRFYKGRKIGIVHSVAGSIAAVVLQACDWRVATPNSDVFIHNLIFQNVPHDTLRSKARMKKLLQESEASQKKINKILAERTGRSAREIRTTCAQDRKMSAGEALEYGLIDQIVVNESDIKVQPIAFI